MRKLSEEQFYEIMPIIEKHLSAHNEFLYHEYGFNLKLESKLEELKYNIKNELHHLTHSNDE